jgi:sugar phosphate isomerase/epimerase
MANLSYTIGERWDAAGPFDNFAATLRRVKELGYDGVEIMLHRPASSEVDTLARFVESIHLPVVSFFTGMSYFSDGLCLCSPRAEVRQRAVVRLQECTKIAAQFGALVAVGQMQGFLSDEPDRAAAEARIEEGLKRVAEAAEQHGATIVFEPVNHLQVGFNHTLNDVLGIVKRIGSARFKVLLDTFHMNIEEKSLTEPIHRAGRNLGHFHLSDSNNGLLGSGHVDFEAVFAALRAIGYGGYVSVVLNQVPWAVGVEASIRFLAELNLARSAYSAGADEGK